MFSMGFPNFDFVNCHRLNFILFQIGLYVDSQNSHKERVHMFFSFFF